MEILPDDQRRQPSLEELPKPKAETRPGVNSYKQVSCQTTELGLSVSKPAGLGSRGAVLLGDSTNQKEREREREKAQPVAFTPL